MSQTLSLESTICVAKGQVSRKLADEAAILKIVSGVFYGLDAIGATIWQMMQTPVQVSHIHERLLDEYDVDAHTCERDLLQLLRELAREDLIEIR